MPDRTTKALLILIAVALWGLLLRPALLAPAAHAADAPALGGQQVSSVVTSLGANPLVFVVQGGLLYAYELRSEGNHVHKLALLDRKALGAK